MAAGGLGLADMGTEERAAASTMLAAALRAGGEDAGATMVRCGSCGFVITSRSAALAPRYCPRCLARRRALAPLRQLEVVHR